MRRLQRGRLLAAAAIAATTAALAAAVGTGSAAPQAVPTNTELPKITGKAVEGETLKTNNGKWTNRPTSYTYAWRRCDASGANCTAIASATAASYKLAAADVGSTIRSVVTASNQDGSSSPATSAQTSAVTSSRGSTAGCAGRAPLPIAGISPPNRLMIDGQQLTPTPVGRTTSTLVMRFHVSCEGKSVQGALVYVTAVPYNQFSVPAEVATGADGWATLTMKRLSGYPATDKQQLLVTFVRARKQGEDVLGGISNRRLVSFKVDLKR